VKEASAKAQTTLAFFNNHPDGAAADNAMEFSAMCGAPIAREQQAELF